jgi:hypothetical protein
MKNPTKEIEQRRLPCGPMSVSIDSVCRRRLRDHFDALFDRLTQEIHPEAFDEEEAADLEEIDPEEFEKARADAEKKLEKDARNLDQSIEDKLSFETLEDKKERMIEEGKMKADVKKAIKEYEEQLMGNSKMLQDTSGKIKKR